MILNTLYIDNIHSSPEQCLVLHTAPHLPKWWNWSCPISNQPVSNSLIWVYKQLHTSPPQFSRLLHTAFISLTHSARSHACTSIDSPAETSGFGWGTPKWDSSLPAALPGLVRYISLSRLMQLPATSLPSTSLGFGYFLSCKDHCPFITSITIQLWLQLISLTNVMLIFLIFQ